jgi:uncharacterized membrane protein
VICREHATAHSVINDDAGSIKIRRAKIKTSARRSILRNGAYATLEDIAAHTFRRVPVVGTPYLSQSVAMTAFRSSFGERPSVTTTSFPGSPESWFTTIAFSAGKSFSKQKVTDDAELTG